LVCLSHITLTDRQLVVICGTYWILTNFPFSLYDDVEEYLGGLCLCDGLIS